MAVSRETLLLKDNFVGGGSFSTTVPTGPMGWLVTDTSSSGTPTYTRTTENGGAAKLTLANTSEAEHVCICSGDALWLDLRQIQHFWVIAKVADIANVHVATFGLASAQNDDEDATTINAFLKIEGATDTADLVAETDDNTTNNDDTATGAELAAVYKKLHIDFTAGLDDVRFYVDGARVADTTTFDMSDAPAGQNVQPYIQLSKASGTGTPSITVAQVGVQTQLAYGA
jgi:hypothetical protein